MSDFWFHVWWRQDDGCTYATIRNYTTLEAAQKALVDLHDTQAASPDTIVAAGTGPIQCPPQGPWPRRGEVGRGGFTAKAPEDVEAA